jgi:DNA-binding NtrC family response regulator
MPAGARREELLPMMPPRVLIIDDERNFREFLGEALKSEGYRVSQATTARVGLSEARRDPPDVVLLDQNLPDRPGLDLLPDLRRLDTRPAVIMITAYAEYARAVAAVKAGAHHYLSKPFEFDDLLKVLADAIRRSEGPPHVRHEDPLGALVGTSPEFAALRQQIRRVASSAVTSVLIHGESGTGKELIARAIHALSDRAARRMVSLNCAALSETLLLSELFGHEKGAFTDAREQKQGLFEVAHRGTIFLDELSEMEPRAQAVLLRALEQRTITRVGGSAEIPVDIRVVAATNRPLERQVTRGHFRADLYYRLNVVELSIPPLRERPEDIPALARHFAELFAARYGGPARALAPEAAERLIAYPWPGNVRELRNVIERCYVVGSGRTIDLADLPAALRTPGAPIPLHGAPHRKLPFREAKQQAVAEFERTYLTAALTHSRGNISRAARRAGMPRQVLQRLLQRHGLKGSSFRQASGA